MVFYDKLERGNECTIARGRGRADQMQTRRIQSLNRTADLKVTHTLLHGVEVKGEPAEQEFEDMGGYGIGGIG